jgi:hypothetical protein
MRKIELFKARGLTTLSVYLTLGNTAICFIGSRSNLTRRREGGIAGGGLEGRWIREEEIGGGCVKGLFFILAQPKKHLDSHFTRSCIVQLSEAVTLSQIFSIYH